MNKSLQNSTVSMEPSTQFKSVGISNGIAGHEITEGVQVFSF